MYPKGIDEEEAGAVDAALGPNKSCLCCNVCCSSIVDLSCSTMIGKTRIVNEVASTQRPVRLQPNRVLLMLVVLSYTEYVKFLTGSGNISVRPSRRSTRVSSSNSISF